MAISIGAVQPSNDYHQLKAVVKERIAALVGHNVTLGTRKKWDHELEGHFFL
jgi:hypothetical protein